MKNRIIQIAIVITLIFNACSPKKAESVDEQKQEAVKPVVAEIKTFENVDPAVKTQINGFLTDYFALSQGLIADDRDAAKTASARLAETVGKFDMSKLNSEQMGFYHEQLAKINSATKAISNSSDVEEIRTEYAPLSDAMLALVRAYHPNEKSLYLQFCPMAKNGEGATWISATSEILNPYMGERMLRCGKTQEALF